MCNPVSAIIGGLGLVAKTVLGRKSAPSAAAPLDDQTAGRLPAGTAGMTAEQQAAAKTVEDEAQAARKRSPHARG